MILCIRLCVILSFWYSYNSTERKWDCTSLRLKRRTWSGKVSLQRKYHFFASLQSNKDSAFVFFSAVYTWNFRLLIRSIKKDARKLGCDRKQSQNDNELMIVETLEFLKKRSFCLLSSSYLKNFVFQIIQQFGPKLKPWHIYIKICYMS